MRRRGAAPPQVDSTRLLCANGRVCGGHVGVAASPPVRFMAGCVAIGVAVGGSVGGGGGGVGGVCRVQVGADCVCDGGGVGVVQRGSAATSPGVSWGQ